jgi:hypothetical protein
MMASRKIWPQWLRARWQRSVELIRARSHLNALRQIREEITALNSTGSK